MRDTNVNNGGKNTSFLNVFTNRNEQGSLRLCVCVCIGQIGGEKLEPTLNTSSLIDSFLPCRILCLFTRIFFLCLHWLRSNAIVRSRGDSWINSKNTTISVRRYSFSVECVRQPIVLIRNGWIWKVFFHTSNSEVFLLFFAARERESGMGGWRDL